MILKTMHERQAADGTIDSRELFRTQLATSCGPAQILYLVAIEPGYRGTFKELNDPRRTCAMRRSASARTDA